MVAEQERDTQGRLTAPREWVPEISLIGRASELESLLAHLSGPGPRSAIVFGPAGIGKSRLASEVVAALSSDDGPSIVRVAAVPEDALASQASIRRLLRILLGVSEQPSPEEARAAARRTIQGQPGDPFVAPLAAVLGTGPPRLTGLAAARAALAVSAARRPLLVVLDDAHQADDATLDVVASLARGEIEAAVALLVLAREEVLDRRPDLLEAFGLAVPLQPLGPGDARVLASRHLGDDVAPTALDSVALASRGNPFFIEELARELLDGGATPDASLGVGGAVEARLDRLSPLAREMVRLASVLGQHFTDEDLFQVRARLADPPGEEALAELLDRRILVRLDGSYAFRHALLRDAAYAEVEPGLRRRVHAAAAEVLRSRPGLAAAGPERVLDLAGHLEGAGDHAGASACFRRAGDLAANEEAPADAYRCYARAAELAGGDATPDLMLRLGEAATLAGAFADAEEALDRAVAGASGRREAAHALHARALLARQVADWGLGVALCRRALSALREAEEPILAARIRATLGWILGYILGDYRTGTAEGERAVELLEKTGDLAELAHATSYLGASYMRAGRWTEQLGCNRRTLEIGIALPSIEIQARAHLNLGVNLVALGRAEEAAAHSRTALGLYDRLCAAAQIALVRNNLAIALVDLGQLDEAESEVGEALRVARLCGGSYFRHEAELTRARIAVRRGRFSEARAWARSAVRLAEQGGSRVDQGIARRTLGAVLSMEGAHLEAVRELDAAQELLRDTDVGELARVRAERWRALARRRQGVGAERVRESARAALTAVGAALDLAQLENLDWI